MSDFTFDIRIEGEELLDAWRDLIMRFPQMIPVGVQKIADKHADPIRAFFAETPGKPVSPWPWVSVKQQRAFFLTDGFGGGIPHERGGPDSLEERWQVVVTYGDGESLAEIEVFNDAVNTAGLPYVDFVQGWKQQPGFAETGWFGPEQVYDFMATEEEAMYQDYLDFLNQALALGGGF